MDKAARSSVETTSVTSLPARKTLYSGGTADFDDLESLELDIELWEIASLPDQQRGWQRTEGDDHHQLLDVSAPTQELPSHDESFQPMSDGWCSPDLTSGEQRRLATHDTGLDRGQRQSDRCAIGTATETGLPDLSVLDASNDTASHQQAVSLGEDNEKVRELKGSRWSLFAVSVEHMKLHLESHEYSKRASDDTGGYLNIYNVACKLALKLNDNLEEQTASDVAREPTNIHAWRNRAIYCFLTDNEAEAERAMLELDNLEANPVAVEMARAGCAYWKAEWSETAELREENCQIFEEILKNDGLQPVDEFHLVLARTKHLYLKQLVRLCKMDPVKVKDDSWHVHKLQRVLQLLIQMRTSRLPDANTLFWLWLSEALALKKFPKLRRHLSGELQIIHQETKVHPANQKKQCIKEISELPLTNDLNYKVLSRVAKNCLQFACDERDETKCRKYLKDAILLCKHALDRSQHYVYMALWTKTKAHLFLWTLDYCNDVKHYDVVFSENRKLYGRVTDDRSKLFGLLMAGPFLVQVPKHNHLKCAHDSLTTLCSHYLTGSREKSLLGRIKYNIDDSDGDVEPLLTEAFDPSNQLCHKMTLPKETINAGIFLARYYDQKGDKQRAKGIYESVINFAEERELRHDVARHCWKVCSQHKP